MNVTKRQKRRIRNLVCIQYSIVKMLLVIAGFELLGRGLSLMQGAQSASQEIEGEVIWSEETKTLSDVFQQLSNLSDQKIDRTVFCVLLDESSNKFNVTAMPLYDLMISGSTYHYKDLMDNDREFKRNGILVACKTRDEIGSFTGVFDERCFLDSEHAWQKAQTMNKEHTER